MLSEDPSTENIAKLRALCEKVAAPFAQHLLTSDDIYATFFKCRAFGKSGGSKSQRVEEYDYDSSPGFIYSFIQCVVSNDSHLHREMTSFTLSSDRVYR